MVSCNGCSVLKEFVSCEGKIWIERKEIRRECTDSQPNKAVAHLLTILKTLLPRIDGYRSRVGRVRIGLVSCEVGNA
jgi:hypothetical protein